MSIFAPLQELWKWVGEDPVLATFTGGLLVVLTTRIFSIAIPRFGMFLRGMLERIGLGDLLFQCLIVVGVVGMAMQFAKANELTDARVIVAFGSLLVVGVLGVVLRKTYRERIRARLIQGIVIHSATFEWFPVIHSGSPKQLEVTAKVRELVSDGTFTMTAKLATFGMPDPAPSRPKKLFLHYTILGVEKELKVDEGDKFTIH